jgi:AraC family transcriptional regulator
VKDHEGEMMKTVALPEEARPILVGAEDPLPAQHFWFEGDGYSIYAAEQPRSAWREHTHDCVQVTVGLEPAHVHAGWRNGAKSMSHRELAGNAVSIIPPGEPHSTVWRRRASLIHLYLGKELMERTALKVLHDISSNLRPSYLVRDPLIEELGRALYRECETAKLCGSFADALITVLVTHLLRTYNAASDGLPEFRGGLGTARERRVREYIERSIEKDLSIEVLAEIAGLSPHYFANRFRQSTGFTPHQYVSHRRVAHAQQLLTESSLSLAEVAYRCGFASQSQFTTIFRRFAGVTPGKFQSK